MKKKLIAASLFIAMATGVPCLKALSSNESNAYGIAAIWSGGDAGKVLGTGAAIIETGAGIALAYGAICPPQFATFAVIGL